MKLELTIPEEFEIDFEEPSKIDDILCRIAAECHNSEHLMVGQYEMETIGMLRNAFKNAKIMD